MREYLSREYCRAECDFQRMIDSYPKGSSEEIVLKCMCEKKCVKKGFELYIWFKNEEFKFMNSEGLEFYVHAEQLDKITAWQFHDALQKKQIRIIKD